MLILNSFLCSKCGLVSEELVKSKTKTVKCSCGGRAHRAYLKAPSVHGCDSFNPHYDLQLGKHFSSADEKRAFLKSVGKVQESGNLSPKKSTEDRVICSKEQSKVL
jgi:hypothetical protein